MIFSINNFCQKTDFKKIKGDGKMDECVIPIIIPSYEPDERLLNLLSNLCDNTIGPVIVVDDGNTEDYKMFFEKVESKYKSIVLRHDVNRGKGRALKTAFEFCINHFPNIVGCITADSDGQHTIEAISKCRVALIDNPECLVLGVRDFQVEEIPLKSQFGNNLTKKVFKLLYHTSISDTQTGLRGIPVRFMTELLTVPGERFEFETRMLIKAVELRINIDEVTIETIYDSKTNHSTHFRPVIDSVRIYALFFQTFGKFVLSSLSSSIIDLVLFQVLCIILGHSYEEITYIPIATIAARIISAIYNYFLNYLVVFRSRKGFSSSSVKYVLLAVVQMMCSAVLTTVFISFTGVSIEIMIKIPVDVFLFVISYKIQKKYIF